MERACGPRARGPRPGAGARGHARTTGPVPGIPPAPQDARVAATRPRQHEPPPPPPLPPPPSACALTAPAPAARWFVQPYRMPMTVPSPPAAPPTATTCRVAVAGASGRMGRMLIEAIEASADCVLVGALDI